MRKISLLLTAVLCLFVSCQKVGPMGPMGPEGPQGPKGDPAEFQWIKLNVEEGKWGYSEIANNNYFVAKFKVPEITSDVFKFGLVTVYRCFDFDTADAAQIELPYIRQYEDVDAVTGDAYFFQRALDYEYGVGWLNIYYTESDFDYELNTTYAPEPMQFRLVIAY